ncbi:putative protocatechuate -dioxygenase beta subunit protein [Neofusicoccum parvum]|uniref:Protocatechuate -dioxygenase beta subunit protein n=2 Tax=Neofusicoccum parvum TaxID=310453 RepID=A0ACB5SM95_9PEZI|nr:putative protocatechuate -dioxygenase beta subunit protein [Neofusicoccum parvum UCRNP2]GME48468.1 putative protocatechuate -dioxygenase beta subunit protein [Neofusicoccum parvum]GME58967.1 putative protocatechuate -dioxygenase beta subunit protein [Neofusicoccum parvum]
MKFSAAFVAAGLLSTSAVAHPGGHHVPRSEMERRSTLSKRCASQVAQYNEKRYAKRMKAKRDLELERSGNTTYQITTEAPYYDVIQNDTCVLTPEVTQGPYVWPRSQILRQDMSEGEAGVPLWLDVGVLDMATCEPLENALVSFWHCNATGSYSSFTGQDPNTPFVELLQSLNITNFTIGETDLHTDDTTFLRGMWPTDTHGMLEMKTVFPGFYVERAIHIHTQVYTDWVLHENGTVSSGNIVSTGQLYFDEDLAQQLMALEPYVSHTEIERTTNDVDTIYDQSFYGYNPVVSVVAADGENMENGVIGYITMGVDTTAIEETDINNRGDE